MIVYTYYEDVGDEEVVKPLLDEWFSRWTDAGFNPVVLGRGMAEQFPSFELARMTLLDKPTVNDPKYELACYNRYMALSSRVNKPSLLMDYDVFPTSKDAKEKIDYTLHKHDKTPFQPLLLGDYAKNSVIFFPTPEAAHFTVSYLVNYQPTDEDLYDGKPHVSDMTILNKSDAPYYQLTGEPGQGFCMTHISEPYAVRTAQSKLSILNELYNDTATEEDSSATE